MFIGEAEGQYLSGDLRQEPVDQDQESRYSQNSSIHRRPRLHDRLHTLLCNLQPHHQLGPFIIEVLGDVPDFDLRLHEVDELQPHLLPAPVEVHLPEHASLAIGTGVRAPLCQPGPPAGCRSCLRGGSGPEPRERPRPSRGSNSCERQQSRRAK